MAKEKLITLSSAKAAVETEWQNCSGKYRPEDIIRETCKALDKVPAAQPEPEPLTDKEQRIFLAAMGREEKICKKVDDECGDCKEPHEVNLISVCHEITRKVKGALWS